MNLKNKENYILINKFFIQNYIMKVLLKNNNLYFFIRQLKHIIFFFNNFF